MELKVGRRLRWSVNILEMVLQTRRLSNILNACTIEKSSLTSTNQFAARSGKLPLRNANDLQSRIQDSFLSFYLGHQIAHTARHLVETSARTHKIFVRSLVVRRVEIWRYSCNSSYKHGLGTNLTKWVQSERKNRLFAVCRAPSSQRALRAHVEVNTFGKEGGTRAYPANTIYELTKLSICLMRREICETEMILRVEADAASFNDVTTPIHFARKNIPLLTGTQWAVGRNKFQNIFLAVQKSFFLSEQRRKNRPARP